MLGNGFVSKSAIMSFVGQCVIPIDPSAMY